MATGHGGITRGTPWTGGDIHTVRTAALAGPIEFTLTDTAIIGTPIGPGIRLSGEDLLEEF